MRKSPLPYLSVYNGPSSLAQTVVTLHALGVRAANVRLLPVIEYPSSPEIAPHVNGLEGLSQEEFHPQMVAVRLGVNVREDNRLARFLPLLMVGLPPADEVGGWVQSGRTAIEGLEWLAGSALRAQNRAMLDPDGDADPAESEMGASRPDWDPDESPADRLTRQLCARFPELREPGAPLEQASDRILVYRRGRAYEEKRPDIVQRSDSTTEQERPTEFRTARGIVEAFLTQAMLSIAAADLLGGFEFVLPIEPQARRLDITIDGSSGPEDIVRWLRTYPHVPVPPPVLDRPEGREAAEWDQYFGSHPQHENIFDAAPHLWTERDPAVLAVHAEIASQYRAGRTDPMEPDEILLLLQRHMPDYVPRYPRQLAVTGGINVEGILLKMIARWIGNGGFLGMTWDDWEQFTPEEQAILCALLLQRGRATDPFALFRVAVNVLVDPTIEMHVEAYQPYPARLGMPLAQPGRALGLGGATVLHAPEMVVRLPFDRTSDERAEALGRRLRLVQNLFLPVHIPCKWVWSVDWPRLGKTARLASVTDEPDDSARQPACRLPGGYAVLNSLRTY